MKRARLEAVAVRLQLFPGGLAKALDGDTLGAGGRRSGLKIDDGLGRELNQILVLLAQFPVDACQCITVDGHDHAHSARAFLVQTSSDDYDYVRGGELAHDVVECIALLVVVVDSAEDAGHVNRSHKDSFVVTVMNVFIMDGSYVYNIIYIKNSQSYKKEPVGSSPVLPSHTQ